MLDQKFWRKYFQAYDLLNKAIPYQQLLAEIIRATKIKKNESVLDAGSGTGNLAILLKEQGAIVTAFDYSSEGQKLHKKKDPQTKMILGDLTQKLSFKNNAFDKIVSNNVIYTIPPQIRKKVFKEFFRILKPGGQIVVANLKEGFKPSVILIDHLKQSQQREGIIKTVVDFFKLSYVLLKIFYYNYLIKKENKKGSYGFMNKGEHKTLLEDAGFESLANFSKLVYSKQGYLDVGKKPL